MYEDREGDSMKQKDIQIRFLVLIATSIILLFILSKGGNLTKEEKEDSLFLGSKDARLMEFQKKLKQMGYFRGEPDGYYDEETREAIMEFQRDNDLKINGIADEKTATAIELAFEKEQAKVNEKRQEARQQLSRGSRENSGDVYLLARAVHGEARGEPYVGKVAVAAVVINRTKSPEFPNTIAGVIYQPEAFTAVSDGQINLAPDEESLRAARDALNGWDPTGGALYYYNPAKTTNAWIWSIASRYYGF
jgi:N-acetylmuramoyl-L-alanine amidase